MPALARKSSRQTTKPARSSTAPANVAERQGDREQGSIRHLVATDGPQLEPTANSLLACLKDGKQGFWLDIENPGDADFDLLEKTFKFHPLTLEDIRNRNQRPKVEEFPGYAFVVLFTAELVNERAEVREHHIYVSPQYLVSVHLEPSEPLADLRQRIKENPDLTRRSLPFLFYLVVDQLVDALFPVLEEVDDATDRLEDTIIDRLDLLDPGRRGDGGDGRWPALVLPPAGLDLTQGLAGGRRCATRRVDPCSAGCSCSCWFSG